PADRGGELAAVRWRGTARAWWNREAGGRVLGEILAAALVDQPLPLGAAHRARRIRAVPLLDREVDDVEQIARAVLTVRDDDADRRAAGGGHGGGTQLDVGGALVVAPGGHQVRPCVADR